jgi:hypothetical protein
MARAITDLDNTNPPDGNFPGGRVRDESVAGANDGTPVDEELVGDFWQFFDRLMNVAGVAFNGLPDSVSNGFQFLEALQTFIEDQITEQQENRFQNRFEFQKSFNPKDFPAPASATANVHGNIALTTFQGGGFPEVNMVWSSASSTDPDFYLLRLDLPLWQVQSIERFSKGNGATEVDEARDIADAFGFILITDAFTRGGVLQRRNSNNGNFVDEVLLSGATRCEFNPGTSRVWVTSNVNANAIESRDIGGAWAVQNTIPFTGSLSDVIMQFYDGRNEMWVSDGQILRVYDGTTENLIAEYDGNSPIQGNSDVQFILFRGDLIAQQGSFRTYVWRDFDNLAAGVLPTADETYEDPEIPQGGTTGRFMRLSTQFDSPLIVIGEDLIIRNNANIGLLELIGVS